MDVNNKSKCVTAARGRNGRPFSVIILKLYHIDRSVSKQLRITVSFFGWQLDGNVAIGVSAGVKIIHF